MDKKQQFNLWYVALALAAIFLIQGWWQTYRNVEPLEYSEFLELLKKGEITEVSVSQNTIEGKFKTPQNGKSYFVTTRVDPGDRQGPRAVQCEILGPRLATASSRPSCPGSCRCCSSSRSICSSSAASSKSRASAA